MSEMKWLSKSHCCYNGDAYGLPKRESLFSGLPYIQIEPGQPHKCTCSLVEATNENTVNDDQTIFNLISEPERRRVYIDSYVPFTDKKYLRFIR